MRIYGVLACEFMACLVRLLGMFGAGLGRD